VVDGVEIGVWGWYRGRFKKIPPQIVAKGNTILDVGLRSVIAEFIAKYDVEF